jgi:hypothetical protein
MELSFLRSQQLLSYSRIVYYFTETERSLLYSKEPSTCPYPEPDKSSPYQLVLNTSRIVTCRPIVRERFGKQTRNKYGTNNRVDPFVGNTRNNKTCARDVSYVGSHISIAR